MMKIADLGGGVEVIQIVEFDGPTHDAQYMLPDATPDNPAALPVVDDLLRTSAV